MKAFVFGEIVWDEYPDAAYIGGASLNFAAHLTKLGDKAALCSAIGGDKYGKKSMAELYALGIDSSFVYKSSYPTGRCRVTLDENKKPEFALDSESAFDYISISEEQSKEISAFGADILYFGTLARRNPISRDGLQKIIAACTAAEIFCDINLRKSCYTPEAIEFCMENAKFLKISRDEEAELIRLGFLPDTADTDFTGRCRTAGEYLAKRYPQMKFIITTLDSDGAVLYDMRNKEVFYSHPVDVIVSSTVGAGDSFFAAFASSYMSGLAIPECLRRAVILSSFVVSKKEAVPFYSLEIFE